MEIKFILQEVEVLDKEEEGRSPEESVSESSEYEEYTGKLSGCGLKTNHRYNINTFAPVSNHTWIAS